MYKSPKISHFQLVKLLLLILVISSCNKNRIYKESVSFDNYRWVKTNQVIFEPEISPENTNKPLKLTLSIRYFQGFPYKYLHMRVFLIDPKGEGEYQDISVQIISDETKYNGDGAGDYWDLDYELDNQLVFKTVGKYKIEIRPFMEVDPINFIGEIGLKIEKKE